MPLTDPKLKALKGRPRAYTISDGEGLYVEVLPARRGAKKSEKESEKPTLVWRMRYWLNGRQEKVTIGKYPAITIKKARKVRRDYQTAIEEGRSPMREKQIAKVENRTAGTVTALCDEFYERMILHKRKHPERVKRLFDAHVKPKLGSLLAKEVRPLQVDQVLRTVAAKAPTTSNDLLSLMKAVFRYGVKRHYLEYNPAANFEIDDAGGEESARTRALSREEIAAWLKAMRETENFGRENELAFKVLLATCVRKSELVQARKDELDLDEAVWHLPAERTKTGAAIDIPLAPPVVQWLRELLVFSGRSEYLLPARNRHKRPTMSPDTLNVALSRLELDMEHFTVHDCRRTARTHLAALGVRPEVAEAALNHKRKGIEGVYNTYSYFDERRAALTAWADLIVSMESDSNVTPIRAGARRAKGKQARK